MSEFTQPLDIAREALRRLAMRRIQPTPDNYRALYHEISGTPPADMFPERALKLVCASLPRLNQDQIGFAVKLEQAVTSRSWSAISGCLVNLLRSQSGSRRWNTLIGELITEFERRHQSMSQARKRESLQQVLDGSGQDPELLYMRLQALATAWSRAEQLGNDANCHTTPVEVRDVTPADDTDHALRRLFAQMLESVVCGMLIDAPELRDEVRALATELREHEDAQPREELAARLRNLIYRVNWAIDDQTEIRQGLLALLDLLLRNIGELVSDDQWLRGQMDVLRQLCGKPLSPRELDDVEQRFREVLERQSTLRTNLDDAKNQIRSMLDGFVQHLGSFSSQTSDFGGNLAGYAQRISEADSLESLSDVIADAVASTQAMQQSVESSRRDIDNMRERVEAAELEIARLQVELAQTSQQMRHDPLTGAFNRKGLDEIYAKEMSRAQRRGSPICLAVLDLDNFKRLNDTYGHRAGDDALLHLVSTVKDCLRPHDSLSRYGGEEFVILLPDTGLDDAVTILQRLQRELTKRFFLADKEKLLITFSAGVTPLLPGEAQGNAIARADAAMYQAKQAGKNRVVTAPIDQSLAA